MTANSIDQYVNMGSPLNRAFLTDAVLKQAKAVLDNQEQVRKAMEKSFVHPEAWIQCAKGAIEALGDEADKAKYLGQKAAA